MLCLTGFLVGNLPESLHYLVHGKLLICVSPGFLCSQWVNSVSNSPLTSKMKLGVLLLYLIDIVNEYWILGWQIWVSFYSFFSVFLSALFWTRNLVVTITIVSLYIWYLFIFYNFHFITRFQEFVSDALVSVYGAWSPLGYSGHQVWKSGCHCLLDWLSSPIVLSSSYYIYELYPDSCFTEVLLIHCPPFCFTMFLFGESVILSSGSLTSDIFISKTVTIHSRICI